MANALYGLGRQAFLSGDIDWLADDIKVILIDTAAGTPDMAEGLERVTTHFMGQNIAQVIHRLRGKVAAKYGGSAIVVGP